MSKQRRAITDIAIKNLKPAEQRLEIPDPGAKGLYVVVQPSGVKSFALRYRLRGRPQKLTLGRWQSPSAGKAAPEPKIGDVLSLDAARKLAASAMLQLGRGIDPADEKRQRADGLTVGGHWDKEKEKKGEPQPPKGMLDLFVERYANKLRSRDQYQSTFKRLVAPEIGDIGIYDLKRSHVVDMLDEIADENGDVAADRALAYFRKACNWHAVRDDAFNSPIVKGMRENSSEGRDRTLDDQEIRDLWTGLGEVEGVPACYPRFVKTLLLNMNRRNEAARMHSTEIQGDVWTVPGWRYKRLPKHKGLDHVIPISKAAIELIGGRPSGCNGNSWFVFTTTAGARPFGGFSKCKRELDKAINAVRARDGRCPIAAWRLHDLRRTGRSLMSRAGVLPDHAERCLGHVIGGVRETYDRYEYLDEKRMAFAKLADLVERIVRTVGDGPLDINNVCA